MPLEFLYRVTALRELSIRANIRNPESGEITMDTFILHENESREDIACVLQIHPAFDVPEWELIHHPRSDIGASREFHGLIRLERIA